MNAPFGGQQQQLYPHQPIPQRPPKKRNTGLIVGLSIGIVFFLALIGGGVAFTLAYLDAHADGGEPYTGDTLPPLCSAADSALSTARTTNPRADLSQSQPPESPLPTACTWVQTEGRDGEGDRRLEVKIHVLEPEYIATTLPECKDGPPASTAPTYGEKACASFDSMSGIYNVSAKSGKYLISVRYSGVDVGMLSPVPPPERLMAVTADIVATAVLRNLPG